jgi:hypothetical protein
LVFISTFTAVCSAQLPDKCAVRLLKHVTITKRQTLSKFECEAGHPWNLALFETDYAMLLGPKIKNMPYVVLEIQSFPTL